MSRSAHFSVTTAAAFVLGGVMALGLSMAVVWGGYGRTDVRPTGDSSPPVGSTVAGAAPSTTPAPDEYLLDVSDVRDASKLPP